MAALTVDRATPIRDGEIVIAPVAATARIYQGALVEIDATGHVSPATKAADKTYFGIALSPADNTGGAAGAIEVALRRKVTAHFAIDTTAVRGKDAYVVDDQTVTDVATGASKCGVIVDTDDDGAWVDLD